MPPDARTAARSVFLLLLAVFTATMCGLPDNTDSETELQTTSALARTGWFALGGTPEGDAIVANHPIAPVRIGTDGGVYSWFGIGQALVALPFYATGRGLGALFPAIEARHAATFHYGVPRSEYFAHLLVGWRNPLLAALTAWCLVRVIVALGGSVRAAWLGGLSFGLASFAWAQARSTLSDVQATFFLFAAFALLVAMHRRVLAGARPRRLGLALFGMALGAAFLTRSATAPALVALGLAAIAVGARAWRRHGPRRVLADAAWAAAPALACFALFLWSNHARFGDPLELGYGTPLSEGTVFSYPAHVGLAGLLVAPGKGLVWMAPLVLLAPLGARRAWRRGDRWLPLALAGVAVAVFAPIVKMVGWYGGWTYGPRYVLPAIPFLWAAAWLAFDAAGRPLRVAYGALAALGLATALPAALVDHQTHQELAIQAARVAWADELPGDLAPAMRDEMLFHNIQWDWRFAAPWAHWRILRRRAVGGGEPFSAREIFCLDADAELTLSHDRQRGFRHLAWVDLRERLDGAAWPAMLASLALLTAGIVGARSISAVAGFSGSEERV